MKTLDTVAFVLAVALSHNAIAQDLDVQVQSDPAAGIATYDFNFSGPPQGAAFLFVSMLQANPIHYPGVLGNLVIDPMLALPCIFRWVDFCSFGKAHRNCYVYEATADPFLDAMGQVLTRAVLITGR